MSRWTRSRVDRVELSALTHSRDCAKIAPGVRKTVRDDADTREGPHRTAGPIRRVHETGGGPLEMTGRTSMAGTVATFRIPAQIIVRLRCGRDGGGGGEAAGRDPGLRHRRPEPAEDRRHRSAHGLLAGPGGRGAALRRSRAGALGAKRRGRGGGGQGIRAAMSWWGSAAGAPWTPRRRPSCSRRIRGRWRTTSASAWSDNAACRPS